MEHNFATPAPTYTANAYADSDRIKAFNMVDLVKANKIRATITQIEKDFGVVVLCASESGSRGWGFPSADSDYDVRFVYSNTLRWHLKTNYDQDIIKERDTIRQDFPQELVDACGWNIRKTLDLAHRSNPTLLEWLASPIQYLNPEVTQGRLVHEAALQFYCPHKAHHHYRGFVEEYVTKPFSQLTLKRVFYAVRAVLACQWIAENPSSPPPMVFAELINRVEVPEPVYWAVKRMLDRKVTQAAEQDSVSLDQDWMAVDAYLRTELVRAGVIQIEKSIKPERENLDSLLFHIVRQSEAEMIHRLHTV